MKRGIIITGPQGSGKTKKASEISTQFSNVVWLNRTDNLPIDFSNFTESTDLIIVEEIFKDSDVDFFCNAVEDGICVKHKGKILFKINPQIVLVYQSKIEKDKLFESVVATNRFDVVKCAYGLTNI